MVKTQKTTPTQKPPKQKPIKPQKQKNKQMFIQLQTHEQNKINTLKQIKSQQIISISPIEQQHEDENNSENIEIENIKNNNQEIEKVCAAVHQLILKNKINSKNAFQVPFINLQQMHQFQKLDQSDNNWKKISSTLQLDSKIYSYRVDAIHLITYKIINTMTRNKNQQPNELSIIQQTNHNNKQTSLLEQLHINSSQLDEQITNVNLTTLQKNIKSLNLKSIDKLTQLDYHYQIIKRKFINQTSLKGLLLNNIEIDRNGELLLDLTRKYQYRGGTGQKQDTPKFGYIDAQIHICRKIQHTKKSIQKMLKQEHQPSSNYDQLWKQISHGNFNYQKSQHQPTQNTMDIQPSSNDQPEQNVQYKKVQDAIKLNPKNKIVFKSTNDVIQDSLSWLSDIDRKMLGITTAAANPIKKNISNKSQKNQDQIDFNLTQLTKNDIFPPQTIQKFKNQHKQQIQQKHLLPLRLFHKFKIQQVMTLRQEPPLHTSPTDINTLTYQQYQQHQLQQIDLRSQQISVRQSKQKLKQLIKKQIDFETLYRKFDQTEKHITPELCFLTVLHLANQCNLKLEERKNHSFVIKSE